MHSIANNTLIYFIDTIIHYQFVTNLKTEFAISFRIIYMTSEGKEIWKIALT